MDSTTVVHCGFDSTPKIGQQVALSLFISPPGYRQNLDKMSFFSFEEDEVIGGRYFFTCALVNDDGPLWTDIYEVIFQGISLFALFLSLHSAI